MEMEFFFLSESESGDASVHIEMLPCSKLPSIDEKTLTSDDLQFLKDFNDNVISGYDDP